MNTTNMQHEYKGLSSGRSKEDQRRSQKAESLPSPYASMDDLTADEEGEFTELFEALHDRDMAKRSNAVSKLGKALAHGTLPPQLQEEPAKTLAVCTRVVEAAADSEAEQVEAVQLGTLILLCVGDDSPDLYSGRLRGVFTDVKAKPKHASASSVMPQIIDALAVVFACHGRACVGEQPLPVALRDLFGEDHVQSLAPTALGPLLPFACMAGTEHTVKDHLYRTLMSAMTDSEDPDLLCAAVDSVGIINERFPGTFPAGMVERLNGIPAKAAEKHGKKDIQGSVRRVLRFMEDEEQPEYVVTMRDKKEALLRGFVCVYLGGILRELCGPGLQRQLVQNETVRRMFNVVQDF